MLAEGAVLNSSAEQAAAATPERRRTSRIRTPAALRLRWPGGGRRAEVATIIDNISAGGFSVRLMLKPQPGERVFALVEFPPVVEGGLEGARLAVRGSVVRVEGLPGGASGVAVKIINHRFLRVV
jgi:hypothetical protein